MIKSYLLIIANIYTNCLLLNVWVPVLLKQKQSLEIFTSPLSDICISLEFVCIFVIHPRGNLINNPILIFYIFLQNSPEVNRKDALLENIKLSDLSIREISI